MTKDSGCGCGCSSDEKTEEAKGCCGSHEHAQQEECGCGHDHGLPEMTLEMEDGSEIASQVLGIFECNDAEYIALLPEGSEDVYLYRYSEEDEDIVLGQIETDEEYALVGEEFMRLINED